MNGPWQGPVIERGLMAADVVGQGFTQISNQVFRDPRLSGLAMGVFGHISTHRSGYGITPDSIARHMRNGVGAIKTALRELEQHGYLIRTQTRNLDGTMGQTVYKITDMPEGLTIAIPAPRAESFPSSQPVDEIRTAVPTSGNTAAEASLPSSQPVDGNPPGGESTDGYCPPKNINQNTGSSEDQNSSSSEHQARQRPRAEQTVLDAGATEEETTRVLDRIKSEHKPRKLSAYVATLARNGDLDAMLAELRNAPKPAAPPPPRCSDPRHDPYAVNDRNLYERVDDSEDRCIGPCPRCHPRGWKRQSTIVIDPPDRGTTDATVDHALAPHGGSADDFVRQLEAHMPENARVRGIA